MCAAIPTNFEENDERMRWKQVIDKMKQKAEKYISEASDASNPKLWLSAFSKLQNLLSELQMPFIDPNDVDPNFEEEYQDTIELVSPGSRLPDYYRRFVTREKLLLIYSGNKEAMDGFGAFVVRKVS